MKKVYKILLFITYLIVIFACLDVGLENDTFYNIKIGQDIIKYGIDMKDHYSWISGLSYTYPHWLFDLLVGIIYNLFDFIGIYIFTYIMYFLIGVSLYYCFKRLKYNSLLSYILMILAIIIIRPYAVCRAQIVTYSLIVLFYYNLVQLINTSDKKRLIYLFVISLLIANFHVAVWPFIFILFLPYLTEFIIYKLKNKNKFLKSFNLNYNKYNIKLLLIAFIVCMLAGFLTPIGLTPFTYLINTLRGNTQAYISEHQPIILWPKKLLLFYILSLLIVIKNKKLYLSDIFLLLGLSVMMLSSSRHRTLFILLSVFIFIKYIDLNRFKCLSLKKINKYKILKHSVLVSSIILLLWYPMISINKSKLNEPFISEWYSYDAIRFIKENINYEDYRIYNEYDYGSILLFNDIKVMLDSRADLYAIEFNKNYDYFTEFIDVRDNYKEIFDKYDIYYAWVVNDSTIYRNLSFDSDYKIVYKNDQTSIFVNVEMYEDVMVKNHNM